MSEQFSKQTIKDKIVLTLFFKRPDKHSPLLDLFLAGTIKVRFEILSDQFKDGTEFYVAEENAFFCDKVKIQPKKELQALLNKKMAVDELRPMFNDGGEKVDELINLFHNKLNQIYDKKKLYGRSIKNFNLA